MIYKIKQLIKQNEELIRYLIVGVLTTVVSLSSYYLCVSIFLNPDISWQLQFANIISWICAVTFAYFSNRKFVFKSKETKILKEATNFYVSRLFTLILDMCFMFVFVTVLKLNDKLIKLINQVLITILNYIIGKLCVFKSK